MFAIFLNTWRQSTIGSAEGEAPAEARICAADDYPQIQGLEFPVVVLQMPAGT
jgi:hypothetical protein